MSDARGPFFAVEGNDVTGFSDRTRAECHLEPIDVERDTYRVFSPDGTEFRLAVEGDRTVLTEDELGRSPDFLADRLRDYLRAVPVHRRTLDDDALAAADLPHLIDEFCVVESLR